jgi:hypothetical protein
MLLVFGQDEGVEALDLNLGTSGLSAQASSAVISTSRVFAGSMMASIHRRAAP